MIPVVEFVDCTAQQVQQRIEDLMRGDMLTRSVVLLTDTGERFIGIYEGISEEEVQVEVTPQRVVNVPCGDIVRFGEYVPPLNRSDEVRG